MVPFAISGAFIDDVTMFGSNSSNMITVDDSKTSPYNLWTSNYITNFLKPILFAGTMQWSGCAKTTWKPFYMTTFKPEHQTLITIDKTAYVCKKDGVYAFTLNVIENAKTFNSFYCIDFAGIPTVVVGKNSPTPNKNPATCQRIMDLKAGQLISFTYYLNDDCSVLASASFLIQELP